MIGARHPASVLIAVLLVLGVMFGPSLLLAKSEDAGEGGGGDAKQEESEERGQYNPWAGMDRNGRIPKVSLPEGIEHPERWRYIPEGRIKPGNVFQRLLVSSFIVPYVFRDGDVGTGFGLGLTDIDFRLKRRREFLGLFLSYTTRGQQRYGFAWRRWLRTRDLPGGGVIQEERSFLRARAEYRKTLTRRFFGFGPDRVAADESSYTDEAIALELGASYSLPRPVDDLVLEVGANAEFHGLSDGTVQGFPSTRVAYPAIFTASEERSFGRLKLELRWDTRDSQRNPYRGFNLGAGVDAALAQTDADVGAVFKIFGSKIVAVPGLFHSGGDENEAHPPTDALAFGFFTELTAGELPFYLLPTLGGRSTLRGYIDGRWRDRASWHASTEYRFWVIPRGFPVTRNIRIERVGLAVFYEAGSVAEDGRAIFHARPAQSYGFGGRVSLERAALFRLDMGFSEDGYNIAAGFGLSF